MKVVILGGNECMERRYKDLCEEYNCRAKVFCKLKNNFCSKIGNPDLLVLFVGTMSHKMLRCAMCEYRRSDTVVVHAPSASLLTSFHHGRALPTGKVRR